MYSRRVFCTTSLHGHGNNYDRRFSDSRRKRNSSVAAERSSEGFRKSVISSSPSRLYIERSIFRLSSCLFGGGKLVVGPTLYTRIYTATTEPLVHMPPSTGSRCYMNWFSRRRRGKTVKNVEFVTAEAMGLRFYGRTATVLRPCNVVSGKVVFCVHITLYSSPILYF